MLSKGTFNIRFSGVGRFSTVFFDVVETCREKWQIGKGNPRLLGRRDCEKVFEIRCFQWRFRFPAKMSNPIRGDKKILLGNNNNTNQSLKGLKAFEMVSGFKFAAVLLGLFSLWCFANKL